MENYANRQKFTVGTTKLELESRGSKDNKINEKIRKPIKEAYCPNIRSSRKLKKKKWRGKKLSKNYFKKISQNSMKDMFIDYLPLCTQGHDFKRQANPKVPCWEISGYCRQTIFKTFQNRSYSEGLDLNTTEFSRSYTRRKKILEKMSLKF